MATLTGILGLLAALAQDTAQTGRELPVLEAHSHTLDIRDGDRLWKGVWTADPTIPLDVYRARRSSAPRTITFVSDLGSLALDVEPGKSYDFTILLDGKDACRTRISTALQPCRRNPSAPAGSPAKIPFRLEGGWIHVEARVNGSRPLDLMLDTGADNLVLHPSALAKGVELRFDGSVQNAGLGGRLERRTSSDNRLEIAGLAWDHELVLYVENQASACDGIVGYVAFDGGILEIDHERSTLSLHDDLPPSAEGFASSPLRFEGTIPAMEVGFDTGKATGSGWFIVDTGSSASLHIEQTFARDHGFEDLETIGTSESRGVGPGVLRNRIVVLPKLLLGGAVLESVPAHVEVPGQASGVSSGCLLGMDVLERFDTILDFRHDRIYLRPSAHFHDEFERLASGPPGVVLIGLGVLALAACAGVIRLRARRRA